MPIFNFECKACKKITERILKKSVDQIDCECGKPAKKSLSTPKFIMKGKGAYNPEKMK
jgi:putative FmdB family regulatory protein